MSEKRPIDIWREKLNYLRTQEAIVADPSQKFQLQKQIKRQRRKSPNRNPKKGYRLYVNICLTWNVLWIRHTL